jgi:hypothetical protein
MTDTNIIKTFPLGRYKSPFDPKDYRLAAFMPRFAANDFVAPDTKWEFLVPPLNQGETPHCSGFALADWGIALPVQDNYTNQNGHDFYYKCKIIDSEPLQENGSCIRSVAKVMKQEGLTDAYAFASSVAEIKWWLVNKGPVICGTVWPDDMFRVDANNTVHITGGINPNEGHCYIINEIKNNELFGIQNSWGLFWGINGSAYIPISEFITLFGFDGEAIAAVELMPQTTLQPTAGFNFMTWLKALIALFMTK